MEKCWVCVCVCVCACAFYIHVDMDDRISHLRWEFRRSLVYISFFGGHIKVSFLLHNVRLRSVEWKEHDTHGTKVALLNRTYSDFDVVSDCKGYHEI
jgi:hypothetical protein